MPNTADPLNNGDLRATSLFRSGSGSSFLALELKTSDTVDYTTVYAQSENGCGRRNSINSVKRKSQEFIETIRRSTLSKSLRRNSKTVDPREVLSAETIIMAMQLNQLRKRALLPERSEKGLSWIYRLHPPVLLTPGQVDLFL